MNDVSLSGTTAVITGGAVGIGRALCVMLARRGARVVSLDIDVPNNAATAELAAAPGGECLALDCDISDPAAVSVAVDSVAARFGGIDLLANNAAVWNDTQLRGGTYAEQTAAFTRAIGACLTGAFHCTAACVPWLEKSTNANIVNLITEHIRMDRLITGYAATGYDCAKFGLWRLTESWAVELAPVGIRVNGLAFGATDTPMLRAVSAAMAEIGMKADDMATAVLNIVGLGPGGPTGKTYDVGFSRTDRVTSLTQIAAIC